MNAIDAIPDPVAAQRNTQPPAIPLAAKIAIGALGGFAAAASKLLGFDAKMVATLIDQGLPGAAADVKVLILLHTPILLALGAIVAALIDETTKLKLFAIGVAAPAIITPWLAKAPVEIFAGDQSAKQASLFISSAYAQDTPPSKQTSVLDGLGYIFGVGTEPRFRVVVGSYKNANEALEAAKEMKKGAPEVEIYVGEKRPDNDFYPVIVGGTDAYLPYDEASKIKAEVDRNETVFTEGSYYSSYDFPVKEALH